MSPLPLRGIFVALLGVIQLTECANLILYGNDDTSLEVNDVVTLRDASSLLYSDYYNESRITVMYGFGYTGKVKGIATVSVLKALISSKDYNVFLLDYEKEASSAISISNSTDPFTKQISYVATGLPEARIVGDQLGCALLDMNSTGIDLTQIYLVGHSLGAQVMAEAGRRVIRGGRKIGWIHGLDPAGPFFGNPLQPTLSAADAVHVLCVHTDPGDYGINKTGCTVDFQVNFLAFTLPDKEDNVQPGCPEGVFTKFSDNDTCSHNRSWMLFIEALRSANLVGSKAANVYAWERGLGDCSDTLAIALDWDTSKRGVYFLNTNGTSPYGLGIAGSCPSAS